MFLNKSLINNIIIRCLTKKNCQNWDIYSLLTSTIAITPNINMDKQHLYLEITEFTLLTEMLIPDPIRGTRGCVVIIAGGRLISVIL